MSRDVTSCANMCVNSFRQTETVASKNTSTNKLLSALKVTVTVSHNGSLHVDVLGRQLSKETMSALSILDLLSKDASSRQKVQLIDKLKVCCGIPEPTLLELADKWGNFYSVRKSVIAKIEGKNHQTFQLCGVDSGGHQMWCLFSIQTVSDGEMQSAEEENSR